jgi:hypothetical protein
MMVTFGRPGGRAALQAGKIYLLAMHYFAAGHGLSMLERLKMLTSPSGGTTIFGDIDAQSAHLSIVRGANNTTVGQKPRENKGGYSKMPQKQIKRRLEEG